MDEQISDSLKYKEDYLKGLYDVIETRRAECDIIRNEYIPPEKAASARERYRRDFMEMLGWPLTEYDKLKKTKKEAEGAQTFFNAAGVPSNLKYRTFEGKHEFGLDDAGFDFIYKYI